MRTGMRLKSKPIKGQLTLEASPSRSIGNMLFFPSYERRRALNIEQSTMSLRATVVQPAMILDRHTLNTEQGVTILLYKVFTKERSLYFSLGKCIFILLQGLRPLILLKSKDIGLHH
jgi:hypothetical protein